MIELEYLDEMTLEQVNAMPPDDVLDLIMLYNDLTRTVNLLISSFSDTVTLINELLIPFMKEVDDDHK